MSRRHEEEEHAGNHERWLLTYSDLITLLMIFFVVMYSMSQVDAKKFASMAQALSVFLGGESVIAESTNGGILDDMIRPGGTLDTTEVKIEEFIEENGLSGKMSVRKDEIGIVVSLNESLLFESGSAEVNEAAKIVLKRLTDLFTHLPNYTRVEGFTDNVPIHTVHYQSNWELASQRAINVAKAMIDCGLNPEKVSTVSFGEYRPLYPNDTTEHKKFNRRVDIVIIKSKYNNLEPGKESK